MDILNDGTMGDVHLLAVVQFVSVVVPAILFPSGLSGGELI